MISESRLISERIGKFSAIRASDLVQSGAYSALEKAFQLGPSNLQALLESAGLRGHGGAGFNTGRKQYYLKQNCDPCNEAYIVCNADEGEPGTFKDRYIIDNDPHLLIQGIIISAYIISAQKGYIYIRGEYPKQRDILQKTIDEAYQNNILGKNILGKAFTFDLELLVGAGSYLVGEAHTMIESIEGKRGYPRIKPPYLAEKGLWQKPTLVNNVETLANVPCIIKHGVEWFKQYGTEKSPGTKLFSISGNINNPGVYEFAFGSTLRQIIESIGGMIEGYQFKGALIGGAAGAFINQSMLDLPLAYETLEANQLTMGSGAIMIIDDKTDLLEFFKSIIAFFKHESCGKCVPCRVGTTILNEMIAYEKLDESKLLNMISHAEYMEKTSLCPLGRSPITPLKSFYRFFKNELN